ncbi:hypothetical protein C8J33_11939 [Rhizobium sp. PP-CC-3G-465]|nr:hypothetical protein C8J33_11939 [Rhizobium sp. PP-CC-3G-465]
MLDIDHRIIASFNNHFAMLGNSLIPLLADLVSLVGEALGVIADSVGGEGFTSSLCFPTLIPAVSKRFPIGIIANISVTNALGELEHFASEIHNLSGCSGNLIETGSVVGSSASLKSE